MNWTEHNIPPQTGRLALITGANSGIGFHTALELARKGAHLILPVRSDTKAKDLISKLKAQIPYVQLTTAILDLSSLASIRSFAEFFSQEFRGQSLDLVINNAGIMALPIRELTVDGYERQFATNFLGPFALTALLFPHLKPSPTTRIVTVSSVIAHSGRIDFDNLQSERVYKPMYGAYAQSKLADLMWMLELQRRLSAAHSPIISVGAHPGIAITNLFNNINFIFKILGKVLTPLVGQNAAKGALPTLYAATAPEVIAGGYYGPDGMSERRGFPVVAKVPEHALDLQIAKRLWLEAERLTGVSFDV